MASRYTDDELTKRVASAGWRHEPDGSAPVTGTLEDALKSGHARHAQGHAPGRIEELETAIELDMLQIEKLWRYLGLPV
ncbi:MAG: hypothetical protein ABI963_13765 [Rhizomicrobium sp.]